VVFLQYIALSSRGAVLSRRAAESLVRRFLRRRGGDLWLAMYIDAFTAPGAALLLARPAVTVADYALPIIYKYFTD